MSDVNAEASAFFQAAEVTPEGFQRLTEAANATYQARQRFAELVEEYRRQVQPGQPEALKLALALMILGKFEAALEWFDQSPDSGLRRFYAAKTNQALGRLDPALEELRQAAARGWDEFSAEMLAAEICVQAGRLDEAQKLADRHARAGRDRADWYYIQGLLCEHRDQRDQALEQYERAITLEPEHAQALFRAARLYDICGNDERAIELYEKLAAQPCPYVNALINLAVIYEDLERYDEALECLGRVLKVYPNHKRALLFYMDVESSRQMVIPEPGDRKVPVRMRLLNLPIPELELPMRVRAALRRMNVRTFGDLTRLTEADLQSRSNFDESAIAELKSLLSQRGLQLGEPTEEAAAPAAAAVSRPQAAGPATSGMEAVLAKPVSELELSVRSRRCLQRLNVVTLGDLIQLTEADLLATRNFGVTSLNEIKARLAEYGLQLAAKRST